LQPRRTVLKFLSSCCLGLGGVFLLGGCGDESKTTGTQLEMSPEVKAELDDMKTTQKEERAARKAERAAARKGR
jgi:hypothetical protein